MSSLTKCAWGPRLYAAHTATNNSGSQSGDINASTNQLIYIPNIFESSGTFMLNFGEGLRHFCTALSPILIPYLLYRCEPMTLFSILKYTAIFYTIGFTLRTSGRLINYEYRRFVNLVFTPNLTLDKKNVLKNYDYEIFAAPVDFKAIKKETNWYAAQDAVDENEMQVNLKEPMKTVRNFAALWAVNSFGRRMLYPGALSLFKLLTNEALNAHRNILLTEDGNKIDSMFWDRRNKSTNGNTLVICFEGNAGFYESGIAVTPNSLDYSVLGWNIPGIQFDKHNFVKGFAESTGKPDPINILKAAEAVMQFVTKLGFQENQIVLYGWSIGGFPASWVSSQYPNLKGFILDASFDDLVPLAEARMPALIKGLVSCTVRRHLNLPIAKNVARYSGPITLIRRYYDEIIITNDGGNEVERRASNRANNLLIKLFQQRYPKLLKSEADENYINNWLCADPHQRVLQYNMDEPKIPKNVESLNVERRELLIGQLCNKHFLDFEAGHNVPLDPLYFNIPQPVIYE